MCDYYSRAATVRGAASIQINMVVISSAKVQNHKFLLKGWIIINFDNLPTIIIMVNDSY